MNELRKFTLCMNCGKEKLTIVIEDDGIRMKELKTKKPDLKKYVKQRKEGGLGRYIIESTMDEVKYSRSGKKNRLSLIKYYDRVRKEKEGK